jgi:hypothetical protein
MLGRKRILVSFVAAVGLAIPMLAQSGSQLRCNVRMLKGEWGFTCTGTAPNPLVAPDPVTGPPIQPFAMNGTLTSDGKGQIWGPGWADFNGTIMQQFAWTLSTEPAIVNPDCTGQVHYVISATEGGPPMGEMDFATVQLNENQSLGMPTSPGMTVTCRVTRVQPKD